VTIHFTKHAQEKFKILSRHGVKIPKRKVIDTVNQPDKVDHSRSPLFIAQSNLDRNHVLRVVYKRTEDSITVITFYPGRKIQYEKR